MSERMEHNALLPRLVKSRVLTRTPKAMPHVINAEHQSIRVFGRVIPEPFQFNCQSGCDCYSAFAHRLCVECLNDDNSFVQVNVSPAQFEDFTHPAACI